MPPHRRPLQASRCEKRLFGEPFDAKKQSFHQDRLGTSIGKVEEKGGFRRSACSKRCPWCGRISWRNRCGNRLFCAVLYYKRSIYQDRLGTNIGKTQKARGAFSAGVSDAQCREDDGLEYIFRHREQEACGLGRQAGAYIYIYEKRLFGARCCF